jgi:hypothetical protein
MNTKYEYFALCRGDTQIEQESFYITQQSADSNGNIYVNDGSPNVATSLIQDGMTWADYTTSIGATTGRVYRYLAYNSYTDKAIYGYLKDSDGNYVLGTDVIKEGTYTAYNDSEAGVAPLD